LFAAVTLCGAALLGGCTKTVSVVSIQKAETIGNTDYYTVTYSDGSTSGFSVKNGEDGQNASLTAEDFYNTYKSYYPEEDITYAEFCEKFFSSASTTAGEEEIALALRSSLRLYSVFTEKSGSGLFATYKEVCYAGSAIIYAVGEEYTYIATNYHMVYDADCESSGSISSEIYVYVYGDSSAPSTTSSEYVFGQTAIPCTYVGGAKANDIAIVKAETADIIKAAPSAVAAQICTEYSVGDDVFSVSNVDGEGISVNKGNVSVDRETATFALNDTESLTLSVMRTSAPIWEGSSGGGVFDKSGRLIGLCNGGSETLQSVNYAIPAATLKAVADGILEYSFLNGVKYTQKLYLGVTLIADNCRYVYNEDTGVGEVLEDVTVSNAESGYPASSLKLKSGDIITAVFVGDTEYKITRRFQIADVLLTVRAGDIIAVSYTRGGTPCVSDDYTVKADDLVKV